MLRLSAFPAATAPRSEYRTVYNNAKRYSVRPTIQSDLFQYISKERVSILQHGLFNCNSALSIDKELRRGNRCGNIKQERYIDKSSVCFFPIRYLSKVCYTFPMKLEERRMKNSFYLFLTSCFLTISKSKSVCKIEE